jgi:hypothetical protein
MNKLGRPCPGASRLQQHQRLTDRRAAIKAADQAAFWPEAAQPRRYATIDAAVAVVTVKISRQDLRGLAGLSKK